MKFKIHNSVYFILIMALLAGYIKFAFIVLLIVFFHELGHIIMIKIFDYEISSINFYPFGGVTKVNKLINSSIYKEIVINMAGIIMQVVLCLIMYLFLKIEIINSHTYQVFNYYNKSIMFFNLLPIIPLDGSNILHLLLEKCMSYQKAFYGYVFFSLIFMLIFFIGYRDLLLNNLIIVFLLIFKLIDSLKNFKFLFNKFLLERHLFSLKYKKIVTRRDLDLNKLAKERFYFFKNGKKVYSEKTLLSKLFDR